MNKPQNFKSLLNRFFYFGLFAIGLFFTWQWTTYQSRDLPEGIFISNDSIGISEIADYYCFQPRTVTKQHSILFFPERFADPKAYAALANQVASQGFTTYIIKSKRRSPLGDYNKISTLFPLTKQKFVLAGHGRGAQAAALFTSKNTDVVKGLILFGATIPPECDLSSSSPPMLSIYTQNGSINKDRNLSYQHLLPPNAEYKHIAGGNHAQFAYLGSLLSDGKASISRLEQQNILAESILKFLNQLEKQ
ncbi:MAG: hypothetical protein RLZZ337_1232 [Bacteroidota bacterium]|jgi:hypothetical protein